MGTLKALIHAISAYLHIRAKRVDLDMLWECMEKEDVLQDHILARAHAGSDDSYLNLMHARLRVVSRARRSIEERLENPESNFA